MRSGCVHVDVVERRGRLLHPGDACTRELAHRSGETLLPLLECCGRDVTPHHCQGVPLDEGADR